MAIITVALVFILLAIYLGWKEFREEFYALLVMWLFCIIIFYGPAALTFLLTWLNPSG